ncbi:MAG: type II toxin-antitoxin system RelE/ParE family toxin [Deferribacteraceae bacterium]|jgi:toxin ParE1/3/4|nr:type II toxin-antitoxin system RelE/ParE family toxin [Deferribacteraceae bacterium]
MQEPETAKQIVALIFEKIEELVKFPLKYSVNTSIFFQHDNTRRMPVKSYNVYYKVNEEQKIIEIARVLHSRRDV